MNDNILTVKFDETISFDIEITLIDEIDNAIAKMIFIEGIGDFDNGKQKICFYCPKELERLLRNLEIEVGNKLNIKYLGDKRKTKIDEFYVRKL